MGSESGTAKQTRQFLATLCCIIVVVIVTGAVITWKYYRPVSDTHTNNELGYDIEVDNRDVQQMLTSASHKTWNKVWLTLHAKPYLVNVIPTGHSQAVLHIAVLQNNITAVKYILNLASCDIDVKTTCYLSCVWSAGTTPETMSLTRGYTDISNFISKFRETHTSRFGDEIPTSVTNTKGRTFNKRGLPLLLLTLVAYKREFFTTTTVVSPKTHFQKLLKIVYQTETGTWQTVSNRIVSSLYSFDSRAAETVMNAKSQKQFFINIVNLYTSEHVYREVNKALSREGLAEYKDYRPPGDDLLLGPYILMLDVLVTYWQVLTVCNSTTYRGISVNVALHYPVGSRFSWLSFSSSSDNVNVANKFSKEGTLFVFDNSVSSHWSPRNITRFSQKPEQSECLYPAGAEFEVTSTIIQSNDHTINVKLLNTDYSGNM